MFVKGEEKSLKDFVKTEIWIGAIMSEPSKGVFWIIEGSILAVPYNKNFSYGISDLVILMYIRKYGNMSDPKDVRKPTIIILEEG